MNIINTRSPYYLKFTPTTSTIDTADFDIRIWSGNSATVPSSATYSITKTPLNDSYVTIEISELIRDYYNVIYGSTKVDALWVKVAYTLNRADLGTDTGNTTYLAFDGFGYHSEGVNPRTGTLRGIFQSHYDTIYFVSGRDIKIPAYSADDVIVSSSELPSSVYYLITNNFWDEYDALTWVVGNLSYYFGNSSESNEQIVYTNITDTENLTSGYEFNLSDSSADYLIKLEEICEPKYDAIRVIFKNRFGALQDIWMTWKSSRTLNVSDESYKVNTMDYSTPSYSIYEHQNIRFNVQATESITLNSPFYPEWMNDHFQELFLSDQVWIEDANLDVFPVTIKSKTFAKKTGVNDKLIQYTIDFEYAFDIIQNVR